MSEAMTKSGRRRPADWQRLMEEFAASGQTQRAFCDGRGVAYSTFCYWRRRLRKEEPSSASCPAPSSGSALVELPMWVAAGQESSDFRVELDLGNGLILRLR
jgi:hypothetical protein